MPKRLGIDQVETIELSKDQLDLGSQKMGDQYANSLSHAINAMKSEQQVRFLSLRDNRLTDGGVLTIIEKMGRQIESLDLSYNTIQDESVLQ